jgi:hypothetical protein
MPETKKKNIRKNKRDGGESEGRCQQRKVSTAGGGIGLISVLLSPLAGLDKQD